MTWFEILFFVVSNLAVGVGCGTVLGSLYSNQKNKNQKLLLPPEPISELVNTLGVAIINPEHTVIAIGRRMIIREATTYERRAGCPNKIKETSVFIYEIPELEIEFLLESGENTPYGGINNPIRYGFNQQESLLIQSRMKERLANSILIKSA